MSKKLETIEMSSLKLNDENSVSKLLQVLEDEKSTKKVHSKIRKVNKKDISKILNKY